MEKCRALSEYFQFVEIARQYVEEIKDYQEVLNLAIDYCIDHSVLSEFLQRYRAEVLGMLLEEFDVDKYERSLREERTKQGVDKMARLIKILIQSGRMKDLECASTDEGYREQLFWEFNL